MHKKKFSNEQQELVALLPQGLPKMTDGAKLVLANIIMLYGTEFAKNNGYVYRSSDDMLRDTEISSKTTLARANRQLTQLGLMTVKSGSYETRQANEYRLSDELLDKINFKPQSVLMGTLSTDMGTLSDGFMGTLSENMGTLCQSAAINQLVEQNKSLVLKISELQSEIKELQSEVKRLMEKSKCTTETDTDIEKEKKDLYTIATSTCEQSDTVSTETTDESTGASAHRDSFSLIEKEIEASAYEEASATVTSTELAPWEQDDDTSVFADDDLSIADRLTLPQSLEESTPPSCAAPPLMEWLDGIRNEIHQGIYDWSLTLTDDDVTSDDATKIVGDVLRNHPEWEDHKGQFSILELTNDTKYKMENRVRNLDVQARIKSNRFQARHETFRKELSA